MVAAITLALVRGWELGLVMLALMPLIAIAGGILAKLTTWGTTQQSEAFSKANGLSSQAIQNMRTVQSFQAEKGILEKFSELLEAPRKVSVKLAVFTGVAGGFVHMCIFTTCVPLFYDEDMSRRMTSSAPLWRNMGHQAPPVKQCNLGSDLSMHGQRSPHATPLAV